MQAEEEEEEEEEEELRRSRVQLRRGLDAGLSSYKLICTSSKTPGTAPIRGRGLDSA